MLHYIHIKHPTDCIEVLYNLSTHNNSGNSKIKYNMRLNFYVLLSYKDNTVLQMFSSTARTSQAPLLVPHHQDDCNET